MNLTGKAIVTAPASAAYLEDRGSFCPRKKQTDVTTRGARPADEGLFASRPTNGDETDDPIHSHVRWVDGRVSLIGLNLRITDMDTRDRQKICPGGNASARAWGGRDGRDVCAVYRVAV